jgi:4-hydroxybenzoate polyprenyltransferase
VSLAGDLYYFFRLSAFGATAVLPLLGAGSVNPRLPPRRVAGLLAVAAAFHAFAYVHNDVCDLPLDRTEPRRSFYPLVRGAISPPAALAVALACVPLAFALHELLVAPAPPAALSRPHLRAFAPSPSRFSRRSFRTLRDPKTHLAVAFALMAAYNRWGKRCPLPPLTDLVQAVSWAALLRYGAAACPSQPPAQPEAALTRLLAAYELLLILMVNGLHGALRDLANDAARGARTTAILFGARAGADGALYLPPALVAYAALLQTALAALPLWAAAANLASHGRRARLAAALGVAAVEGATLAVLAAGRRRGASTELGMAHLVLVLSAPVALVAPGLAPHGRAALIAAHLAPLLSNSMTYDALCWAMPRLSATAS